MAEAGLQSVAKHSSAPAMTNVSFIAWKGVAENDRAESRRGSSYEGRRDDVVLTPRGRRPGARL